MIRGPAKLPRDDKGFRYISVDTWFCYPDLKEYYGPSNIVHILKFIQVLQHQVSGQFPSRGQDAHVVSAKAADS